MKITQQVIRHIITGAVADIVDLGFFEIIFILFKIDILAKTVSFLIAVVIKYAGNKYWAFQKLEKDGLKKEAAYFLAVTLVGLFINVASFYLFTNIKTGISANLWRPICVILAMGITAVWNFSTYKFLVFKK